VTDSWSFLLERPEISIPRAYLESALAGRKIVITGAAGSVGTTLSRMVTAFAPEQLVLIDDHEASLFRLSRELGTSGQTNLPKFVLADVRDDRKLRQVFRRHGVDVVFHLAAYKQVPLGESNVDQVLDVNVLGTANVVGCARERGGVTVVYPSTDKAVQPSSLYGASKRIVERYLHSLAMETSDTAIRMVRLVNVFGTQGSVIEGFARLIQADRPIGITDLGMDRYWITMSEATQLVVAAAGRAQFEGIHLLDVGEPAPILRTATRLFQHLKPGAGDPEVQILGPRPGERLHELLHLPDERVRQTDLEGLLVVDLPAPAVSSSDWEQELVALRESMYALEPAALKQWAFDAAIEPGFCGRVSVNPDDARRDQ
jgi:O-antigen biosynthesis protein WbqV